ncbi:TolC family protein [Cellulophaga baltica]|uniref:TolC family protein n=1 Tax=Cellulophaga TaxID=104264 RepID=UPI001C065343|nr:MULTISPECIES: TolC family protein [Cellulophaga]MBU2995192.1 TolC family protein [Cellulophaga baltica]MDO6766587.1 TolC family protein [Cellulophaga sp. 1_MG-2023]
MKFKITSLLLLLVFISGFSQEKRWTLAECVEYAVENNLSIAQYELDLEGVVIDKSDALGNFLPSVNGSVTASGNTGLSFDPTTNQAVTTTIFTASGSVTSSLTLFDGLQNLHTYNRAKLSAIASQYRLDDLKDDIRLNVANAYLNVLSNKESLRTFQAQYNVTQQDINKTKELVDAGVVPRGDLLEVEATLATQEQQIVNAENLILISKINLAQLLQITEYQSFDIADEVFEVPPSNILGNSPKAIFQKALTFRNDIKNSELNVNVAEKDLQIAKGALYPTLNAFFQYNTAYSGQQQFDTDVMEFYRESFKNQLWMNDGISYGAQLNIPVFNGFGVKNTIKRSKINIEKAKVQLEQDKLALETNINQAYVDVKSFSKAYEAAEKTLEARRLAYEYSKDRFEVGLMNSFDYSQAQARVDDAEAQLIKSKYDYIFRLKVLEFYFGLPLVLN